MRMRPCARALALLLCALGEPSAASAQEATPLPIAAATPAPPAPAAIPLPELAREAERAERLTRSAQAQLAPDAVASIASELAVLAPSLAERSERVKRFESEPPSLEALALEERFWSLARDQLAGWNQQLTTQLEQVEARNDELTSLRETWRLTQESALAGGAPAEVLDRISALRSALKAAQIDVRAQRKSLLAFQAGIADQEGVVRGALEQLAKSRADLRERLFWRDSPPLWQLWAAAPAEPAPQLDSAAALREPAVQVRAFLAHRLAALALWAVGLGLLLMASLRARGFAPEWREDERLASAAAVLERPIASALLLALVAMPLVLPRAPALLGVAVAAALAIPVLRLLSRITSAAWRPALALFALIAATDLARALASESVPDLDRVLFLAECVAACAVAAWLARPHLSFELATLPRSRKLLALALRVALVLLAVAVAGNLLGYLSLARLLGRGVMRAASLAAISYAAVCVMRAALQGFLHSGLALRSSVIRRRRYVLGGPIARLTGWAAALLWAWFSLDAFGLLDDARGAVASALSASARFGEISVSLGDLVAFALTLGGAAVLARAVRVVLEEDVLNRFPTGRGVSHALSVTAQYVLVGIGATLAAAAAGIDFSRITLLAGAFGVGVGFGLQNVVSNFVSGLILLYERPIQVGDLVQVGDVFGEVRRIGIRSSTIRTLQGAEVIVPNASLIADQVTNWTLSDTSGRIDIPVGVAYGTDPERVLALLLGVAAAHPDVLEEPAPSALFRAFGESSLDFELRCWLPRFERFPQVQSDVSVAIYRALREAGVEIPFPQRDVHVRSGPEARERG